MKFNQEEANRRKTIIQDEAFKQFQQHPNLLLSWATGLIEKFVSL